MPPPPLTHRCWNHGERPAVVRCPSCGRHFCRECVTEHEGRMVCASCVGGNEAPAPVRGRWTGGALRAAHTAVALFVAWLAFLGLGRALSSVPTALHEGTLWEAVGQGEDGAR